MNLTVTALAQSSGTSEDRIKWLVELGVLEPVDDAFRPSDIQRVRVIEAVDRAGISPQDLGLLVEQGWFSFAAADVLFPDPIPLTRRHLEEVAHDLDMPLTLARRALTVWSVAPPARDDPVRDDDVAFLEVVARTHEILGRDEERTLAAVRYFGENLRRIAESQMRWFRTQLVAPALERGARQPEVISMIVEMANQLLPLARQVVDIGYRRHLEHYSVEVTVENIELAFERAGLGRSPLGGTPAIAFVDLTGFTALSEDVGDEAAAGIAERLTDTVRQRAAEAGGRAVKFMGDGAMLHFPDPVAAARCVLGLVDEIPALGLPQAHAGISSGPVVFSDGDYFGRTVNLAARIADQAGPHQVLIADGVLDPVPQDLRLASLGPVSMKGISEPVSLHRVLRA